MQNQIVKSGSMISGGYLLTGMVISGICEINAIKSREYISYLLKLPNWFEVGISWKSQGTYNSASAYHGTFSGAKTVDK